MSESATISATNDDLISKQPGKGSFDESLIDFIKYLFKLWWIFAALGIIAGIAGFFYARMQKVKYQSRLTFVLDQGSSEGGISGAISLAAQFGLNLGGGEDLFSGDNILEITKSRRIVESVLLSVDTFNNKPYTLIEYFLHQMLPEKESKKNNQGDTIHFPATTAKRALTYKQDSVLYNTYLDFANSYIVADRPDKKLSIFSINVTSYNERFAKVFTDRLIHATGSFYTEISSKKEKETLEILEQRVASMRGNLSSSISDRAATQDANVNPAFSSAQVPLQKQQANIQVYGAAYGEMFKNLELARFQYLKKIPLIQIIDEANYPMKKIKVGKVKTAIIFSFAAVFAFAFVLWMIRIYKLIL